MDTSKQSLPSVVKRVAELLPYQLLARFPIFVRFDATRGLGLYCVCLEIDHFLNHAGRLPYGPKHVADILVILNE